jgi:hypothetical protein
MGALTIRKATQNRSLRITWIDGKTTLDVNIYERGISKCQVAVQHNKVAGVNEARQMKAYWKG